MRKISVLFTVLIWASITNAAALEGAWEGDGHVIYTEGSKDLEPCEHAKLDIAWTEPDMVVTNWSTCVVDWDVEPLTFVNGVVFRRELPIGSFTQDSFRFEYRSMETALVYSVNAWVENDTLVMEEFLEVPNLWWSKGYYKYQRK
jgi:hypothetical protein